MVGRPALSFGIVVGAVVAGPLVVLVGVPLVATFLEWVVAVPGAFLVEILPGRERRS